MILYLDGVSFIVGLIISIIFVYLLSVMLLEGDIVFLILF